MSINPGINVRPAPSIIWVLALRSTGIGAVEIFSILLPRTRTFVGPESCGDLPSNTRTFSNRIVVGCVFWAWVRDAKLQSNREAISSLLTEAIRQCRGWWALSIPCVLLVRDAPSY